MSNKLWNVYDAELADTRERERMRKGQTAKKKPKAKRRKLPPPLPAALTEPVVLRDGGGAPTRKRAVAQPDLVPGSASAVGDCPYCGRPRCREHKGLMNIDPNFNA